MADADHPKTHVENQEDVTLPYKQPESPKREGIDPLTEGDTMYPKDDTKTSSEKLTKKQNNTLPKHDDSADRIVANQNANKVGSDKGNTSPSNKPATQNQPQADGTDTPKPQTTEPKTSSR